MSNREYPIDEDGNELVFTKQKSGGYTVSKKKGSNFIPKKKKRRKNKR